MKRSGWGGGTLGEGRFVRQPDLNMKAHRETKGSSMIKADVGAAFFFFFWGGGYSLRFVLYNSYSFLELNLT